MAGVFDVVVQAGSLPLDELKLRSSAPDVDTKVAELEKLGLVERSKETFPSYNEEADIIKLTKKGFRAAIA